MKKSKAKFRSGFETTIAAWLEERNIRYVYEGQTIEYLHHVRGMRCGDCLSSNCAAVRRYTPDFWLPEHGFYIEAKGLFDRKDRTLHRELSASTMVDIRLVFQYDNWVTKKKAQRYTDWATSHNRLSSVELPDERWFHDALY